MSHTDCTPYLLQLGLTKSKTSLVWIAGPLSGLIMQPVVGVLADSSKSKWGRRRPFMVDRRRMSNCAGLDSGDSGNVCCRRGHGNRPSVERGDRTLISRRRQKRSCTIALAVLSIYAVDFAINAGKLFCRLGTCRVLIIHQVQSSCRSLIVDTLPISKQQLGSAWGKYSCPLISLYAN